MIKRVGLALGCVFLGLVLLAVSTIKAMADENVLGIQTVSVNSVMDEKQALLEQENNYYLAYPGILPDHPIYWMKMLRDKILESVTSDSQQKTEMWMNFADKRLGGSKVLIEGNQKELGMQTAIKANGYLNKAVTMLEESKRQNKGIGDMANRMERQTLKHSQVLNGMSKVENGDISGKLNGLRDEDLKLHERVEVVLGR